MPASPFRTFIFFLAFVTVSLIWLVKVYIVLKYIPSILRSLSSFTNLSLTNTCGWIKASLVSGVKRVTVDFSGDICSSRSSRNSTI